MSFLTVLSLFLLFSAATVKANCDDFYAGIDMEASWDSIKGPLHDRLVTTHVHKSYNDAWEALGELDAWPANGSFIETIYGRKPELYTLKGDPSGWNREHLWPRSYGLGDGGMDHDDLHMLRAADWNVNSARGNLYFGTCNPADDACISPAHSEAADDTSKDSVQFQPPAEVRGDIARAIIYMAYRYNGSDSDTYNLMVSSCPCSYAFVMGNLTELLQWHVEDPVSTEELERLNETCTDFQNNRNPFIDYPDFVFDAIDELTDDTYCTQVCDESVTPTDDDTVIINDDTLTTSTTTTDTSSVLSVGDFAILSYTAHNPDMVTLLALNDIPGGVKLFISDNGYCNDTTHNTMWRDTEGVLSYTVPSSGLAAGELLDCCSSWTTEKGNFALSDGGDQVFLYTLPNDDIAYNNQPSLIASLDFSSSGYLAEDQINNYKVSVNGAPFSCNSNLTSSTSLAATSLVQVDASFSSASSSSSSTFNNGAFNRSLTVQDVWGSSTLYDSIYPMCFEGTKEQILACLNTKNETTGNSRTLTFWQLETSDLLRISSSYYQDAETGESLFHVTPSQSPDDGNGKDDDDDAGLLDDTMMMAIIGGGCAICLFIVCLGFKYYNDEDVKKGLLKLRPNSSYVRHEQDHDFFPSYEKDF